MNFVVDKQTLDDINILGRYQTNSVFSIFNHTVTRDGSRMLEKMFKNPFTSVDQINTRAAIFSFFEKLDVSLPFTTKDFETVVNYIRNTEAKNRLGNFISLTKYWFLFKIANDQNYCSIREGLEKTISVFSNLKKLFVIIEKESVGTPYHSRVVKVLKLLGDKHMDVALQCYGESPLGFKKVLQLGYIFKVLLNNQLEDLLNEIFELDIYITVSGVARERNFTYARAVDKDKEYIDMKEVRHPSIEGAVANDVNIRKNKNVFFLTGANMAGKSTLMKSFAVAFYLAHMGFPVAAREMTFSLHDGIYTSINVPDNLSMGYSHFYAEVLRVKHVASEVASNKQLLVIFDELFKGTNVKDAYDGTVAIVDAFSKRKGSFIISTHITEAGEKLSENSQLFFQYLPTIMKGHAPTYTYKLKEGITDDHHGMIIIQNEKILEIINRN